jgi:hypothetical protein
MSRSDFRRKRARRLLFEAFQGVVLIEYNAHWRGRVDMDDDDNYRDFVDAVHERLRQTKNAPLGELAYCSNLQAIVSLAVGTLARRGLIDPGES